MPFRAHSEVVPIFPSDEEWYDLARLVHEARFRRLAPDQDRRLRAHLAWRDPRALAMEWDELVRFGMLVIGFAAVTGALPDLAALHSGHRGTA